MFAEQGRILFLDDDPDYSRNLIKQLDEKHYRTEKYDTPDLALDALKNDPQGFQFAVVDQTLQGDPYRGIEATSKLLEINSELLVLVYTNIPSDDQEQMAKYRFDALSAGAFRYMERGKGNQAPFLQVEGFIDEMKQLTRLRDWVRRYYEDRVRLPWLQAQVDVAMDIIDRSYKVWFMNDKMRELVGIGLNERWKGPCASWHRYRCYPCYGCGVEKVFATGQPHERFFLSPFDPHGRLASMWVSARPVCDEAGKPILAGDGKPLAVMETVQDWTDSARLRQMPLAKRLGYIASALHERPVKDCYVKRRLFEQIRIATAGHGAGYTLQAAAGSGVQPSLDTPFVFGDNQLAAAAHNTKETGFGWYFGKEEAVGANKQPFIYCPVLDKGHVVAVLSVAGSNCNGELVGELRRYVEEIRIAIEDDRSAKDGTVAEVETEVGKIDLELQANLDPLEVIRHLVRKACELTNSIMGHVRYRKDNEAVLLRLDLGALSLYERTAEPSHPMSYRKSWSVRTILSAAEEHVCENDHYDAWLAAQESLSKRGRNSLAKARALCVQPLVFQGTVIGSLCLHSPDANGYSDVQLLTAREIACRLGPALHDYLVAKRAADLMEEQAQMETFGLIIHNAATPVATIRNATALLKRELTKPRIDVESAEEWLDILDRNTNILTRIRSQFLELRKPPEQRIVSVRLPEILQRVCAETISVDLGITTSIECPTELTRVDIDAYALEMCLIVFLRNAVDELSGHMREKSIKIVVRRTCQTDWEQLEESKGHLAVDVVDNGPGVSEAMLPGLFRLIKSSKASGTGFGLRSARHVARSAWGEVYHRQQQDSTTCFSVLLPFKQK